MGRLKVLFVCIHNSARSQMAEAFLKVAAGERFEVKSAGLKPGRLNPIVVEVMMEAGIDISMNSTKGVLDMLEAGEEFDYVITVCDEASAEACPDFPGRARKLHWGFTDPSSLTGTKEEMVARTREIRDTIKSRVHNWIKNP